MIRIVGECAECGGVCLAKEKGQEHCDFPRFLHQQRRKARKHTCSAHCREDNSDEVISQSKTREKNQQLVEEEQKTIDVHL